ncbi:tyrosine-type recombinase/integrase [Bacillus haimaensis]|uniref:tyrosine-type recombinase/integrase n=1 Tax=Bacillus haimaensis TaxID=3160967 RepID=UPI003AA9B4B5
MFNRKLLELEEILKDDFTIPKNELISKNDKFDDDVWDFYDKKNQRLNSVCRSKQIIKWVYWQGKLPDKIINDVKILAYFYVHCPSVLSKTSHIGSSGYKPNTLSSKINVLLDYLLKVYNYREVILSNKEKVNLVLSLSDITLGDLNEVSLLITGKNKTYFQTVKSGLMALGNPIIQKFLGSPINWSSNDLKYLRFGSSNTNNIKVTNFQSMPLDDNYFNFIVKQATIDVISFMKQMNIEIITPIPETYKGEIKEFFKGQALDELFKDYVFTRGFEREQTIKFNKRTSMSSNLKRNFLTKHEVSIKEFNKLVNRVHRAALFLLFQFTGVRYSEAIGFKIGCLRKVQTDLFVIKGAVIKHRSLKLPVDIDEWVAAPIVRDAIKVLEEISKFTFNKFLVSNTYTVCLNVEEKPYSNKGINDALSLYVADIDTEMKYSEMKRTKNGSTRNVLLEKYKISVHRLRHTLALNLIRAKLGIPYISYHLKHVHTAIVSFSTINDVTLGYGGIKNELFNSAIAINQAQGELVNEIYHPNSPVEGGSNKEEFKNRRKNYFQGLMVNDEWELEEIMEMLKKEGAPFADVGLGYCGGKKDIVLKDGSKQSPPCIGQLKCNPKQCGNAIIPKSKIPLWVKMYKENKEKLRDPNFAYSRNTLEKFDAEARSVIEGFGLEVEIK